MWAYEKKLQYPVKIKNPNPLYAKIIVSQLGGPDGELGAALRYLNQRYTMPYGDIIGILTDVGTEAKCQRTHVKINRFISMIDKKSKFYLRHSNSYHKISS